MTFVRSEKLIRWIHSAITVKGQATIPKAIREHPRLKAGDRLKFFVHPDGSVVLLPKRPASILRGIIKSKRRPVTLKEMDAAIFEGAVGATSRQALVIGLDTNVLVRHLTQDDPVQSPKATEIIEHRLTEENPGFVSIVVMVETVWVLERAYSLTTPEIAAAIEHMLQADVLVIQNEHEVFTAMVALKQGLGSFADAILAALGAKVGAAIQLHSTRRLSDFQDSSLLNLP